MDARVCPEGVMRKLLRQLHDNAVKIWLTCGQSMESCWLEAAPEGGRDGRDVGEEKQERDGMGTRSKEIEGQKP